MINRLNAYRTMWIIVMYDLPTERKIDRSRAAKFRKRIMGAGFQMFMFSKYIRHCMSMEHAETHIQRVKNILPPYGKIGIMCITDKQFAIMQVFHGVKSVETPPTVQQLELF